MIARPIAITIALVISLQTQVISQTRSIDNPELLVYVERKSGAPVRGAEVIIEEAWGIPAGSMMGTARRTKYSDSDGRVVFDDADLQGFIIWINRAGALRRFSGPGSRVDNAQFEFRMDLTVRSSGLAEHTERVVFLDDRHYRNVTLSRTGGISREEPIPEFPFDTYVSLSGGHARGDEVLAQLKAADAARAWGPNNDGRNDVIVYETEREAAEWLRDNIPLLSGFRVVQERGTDNPNYSVIRIFVGR